MDALQHVVTMAGYNRWMNTRIYDAAATLDDTLRKRDQGAYFGSVHGTLNHLLLADRIWMSRFTNCDFAFESLAQELYADFAKLRAERQAEDARIEAWVGGLTKQDLDATLSYTSAVNPQRRSYPLWFALTHFFNHQTHHRGQITVLLTRQGVDPGVTDLIWLPDFQH